jgi:hypothetical protein
MKEENRKKKLIRTYICTAMRALGLYAAQHCKPEVRPIPSGAYNPAGRISPCHQN